MYSYVFGLRVGLYEVGMYEQANNSLIYLWLVGAEVQKR